jgi:hypothetical protein
VASALEEFRAQKEAVEDVRSRLGEVADLLRAIKGEADALAHDENLHRLLRDEQTWLMRAQDLVNQVSRFRESEISRFWPAVWRRWAIAMALALVTAFAAGAGYVWAGRPYEVEMTDLRQRAELGDSVARRVLRMTPVQRRQFDALMKGNDPGKR